MMPCSACAPGRRASIANCGSTTSKGHPCHLALDLASKTDLASLAIVFPEGGPRPETRYSAFVRSYLNEAAVLEETLRGSDSAETTHSRAHPRDQTPSAEDTDS